MEEEEEDVVEHTWSDVEEVYVITHDMPAFVAAYIDWKSKANLSRLCVQKPSLGCYEM